MKGEGSRSADRGMSRQRGTVCMCVCMCVCVCVCVYVCALYDMCTCVVHQVCKHCVIIMHVCILFHNNKIRR